MDRRFERSFPTNRENNGPALNEPARSIVSQVPLDKLKTRVIRPGRFRGDSIDGVVETSVILIDGGSNNPAVRGELLTPITTLPLVPVFNVKHGGGRSYGGGTSAEALRRARRKSQLHH